MQKQTSTKTINNIYTLDGKVPLTKAFPFGLQHVLAMFVANIAPIFIVSAACNLSEYEKIFLMQSAMVFAGVGTFLQLFPIWRFGAKMPIVTGISFTFVSVFCLIGQKYGYGAILGAVLIGGLFQTFLGLFAKYWIKIISPIVAACVVTSIGFSLLPVGAKTFGGGAGAQDFASLENLGLAFFTLICCLFFNIFLKGNLKQLSILFGLTFGFILALTMGKIDFSSFRNISILSFPHFMPFRLDFKLDAVIPVVLLFLISSTETIGDVSALADVGLKRKASLQETSGALACDGAVSAASSFFGGLPITSYSGNIGLVAVTKVVNRHTIATGAAVMVIAGIIPVFGALFTTLPDAVLGGAVIMLFGNIMLCGFKMIADCKFTSRNITIAAIALTMGIGFTQEPELFKHLPDMIRDIITGNCITIVFVVAVLLDLILPKEPEKN